MTRHTASRRARRRRDRPDFTAVNRAALAVLPALLRRWLPDGRIERNEYVALNPRRSDRGFGSFSINLRTGRWAEARPVELVASDDRVAVLASGVEEGDEILTALPLAE